MYWTSQPRCIAIRVRQFKQASHCCATPTTAYATNDDEKDIRRSGLASTPYCLNSSLVDPSPAFEPREKPNRPLHPRFCLLSLGPTVKELPRTNSDSNSTLLVYQSTNLQSPLHHLRATVIMTSPIPDNVKDILNSLTAPQQVVMRSYIATLRAESKDLREELPNATKAEDDGHAHYHGHEKCTADHGHDSHGHEKEQ